MIIIAALATNKRLKQLERNASDKRNIEWRKKVLARDEHRCQFPHCSKTENLQVHHIKRFVDAAHLRYATHNGITLCQEHHRSVTGRESYFEITFYNIVWSKIKN